MLPGMSPVSHGLLSWLVGETLDIGRRGRIAVTAAGLAPDLDGLGAPVEMLSDGALPWFTAYHHAVLHNGLAGVVVSAIAWAWCRDWRVGLLAIAAFHLHLVCDIVGSRGPDGHDWPIPYLLPFHPWEWRWDGQWRLDSWQNLLVTGLALVAITVLAVRRGRSPVELLSPRWDQRVVETLRQRLGRSAGPGR